MRLRGTLTASIITAGLGTLGACAGHTNYPAVAGARAANENPNEPNPLKVSTMALKWVVEHYPSPDGDFAINMPPGTRTVFYDRAAKDVSPKAHPMSPDAERAGLPVFHVGRVWVRDREAKVDVFRPMPELGAKPGGGTIYQVVTVTLQGGQFQQWRVATARSYEPDLYQPPPPYYIPDVDRPDQFKYWKQTQGRGQTSAGAETPQGPAEDEK